MTAIELGVGTGSALRLVLLLYQSAHVVAVDCMCYEKVVELVRAALPAGHWELCKHRFHYECLDLKTVTQEKLDAICMQYLSVKFDEVLLKHFSPNCQANSPINELGSLDHRDAAGNPVSAAAKRDDAVLENVITVLMYSELAQPVCLITIEQPQSAKFVTLAPIQRLITGGRFRVLTASWCKVASLPTGLHEDYVFTKKPSIIITNQLDAWLPDCYSDCKYRLTSSPMFHKQVICNHRRMLPEQQKVYDVMDKGRIPLNVFLLLWIKFCNSGGKRFFVNAAMAQNKSSDKDTAKYLHGLLGHASSSRLLLSCKEMGLPEHAFSHRCHCRACLAGKITRASNMGGIHRGKFYGHIVWMDILEFESIDLWGRKYLLVMVEDWAREWHVFPLAVKSGVGKAVEKFSQQHFLPCILRTDGGGEMGGQGRFLKEKQSLFDDPDSESLNQFCANRGIKQEVTVPYNHDQMSPVDVACRRLQEMVRVALYAADAPKQLWSYCAMHMALINSYLVNREQGLSPYKKIHGVSPLSEVSKLLIWGTRLTFRVEPTNQKLDMRGHRGLYLGMNPDNGGALVLDLESIDPSEVTTLHYSVRQLKQLVDHEPRGVDDTDLLVELGKLEGEDMTHIPLRVVRRVPAVPANGQSVMWRAWQEFSAQRKAELIELDPAARPVDVQWQVRQEWHDAVKERVRNNIPKQLELQGSPLKPEQPLIPMHPTPGAATTSDILTAAVDGLDSHNQSNSGGTSSDVSAGDNSSLNQTNSGGIEPDFVDTACDVCSATSDSEYNPIILCSKCPRGFHVRCLGALLNPSSEHDDWYCKFCRQPGLQIVVQFTGERRQTRRAPVLAQEATILAVYDDGTCQLQFVQSNEIVDNFPLDHHRWAPATARLYTVAAAMSVTPVHSKYLAAAPKGFKSAMKSEFAPQWSGAMLEHMKTLFDKGVFVFKKWQLVPKDALILPTIWVYRIKVEKFKARLCCLGNQAPDTDGVYETAAPVVRTTTWKLMFAVAVKVNLVIGGIDLEAGFCQTKPQRPIYLRMPSGVSMQQVDGSVGDGLLYCNFNLFGMPEAPHDLYGAVSNHILAYGLVKSTFDCCLYHWPSDDSRWKTNPLFVFTHVDDIKTVSSDEDRQAFNTYFKTKYDVEDLGVNARWQGIECNRTEAGLYLTQTRHIDTLVERAGLTNETGPGCNIKVPIRDIRLTKDMSPKTDADRLFMQTTGKKYRELTGGLCWLAGMTRYDIAYAAKEFSRYNDSAGPEHYRQLLKCVQYLKKTRYHGLFFSADTSLTGLLGWGDADFNGDPDERLSTGAWLVKWNGCMISHSSRSHKYTARSVLESEYGAMASLAAELIFWRQFMNSIPLPIFHQQEVEIFAPADTVAAEMAEMHPPMQLFSDSASALASAAKPIGWMSDKLKHVENHIHFFRQWVQLKLLKLSKVPGKVNPANIGTKGFNSPQQFHDERALTMTALPNELRICGG